jgi:hypothetical protein
LLGKYNNRVSYTEIGFHIVAAVGRDNEVCWTGL